MAAVLWPAVRPVRRDLTSTPSSLGSNPLDGSGVTPPQAFPSAALRAAMYSATEPGPMQAERRAREAGRGKKAELAARERVVRRESEAAQWYHTQREAATLMRPDERSTERLHTADRPVKNRVRVIDGM